jgi:hypothetical protein
MHQPIYCSRDEYMLDIINQTDFIKPPADFIECAKIKYIEGDEEIISFAQLRTVIEGREYWDEFGIETVKLKLDVEHIKSVVFFETDRILTY